MRCCLGWWHLRSIPDEANRIVLISQDSAVATRVDHRQHVHAESASSWPLLSRRSMASMLRKTVSETCVRSRSKSMAIDGVIVAALAIHPDAAAGKIRCIDAEAIVAREEVDAGAAIE